MHYRFSARRVFWRTTIKSKYRRPAHYAGADASKCGKLEIDTLTRLSAVSASAPSTFLAHLAALSLDALSCRQHVLPYQTLTSLERYVFRAILSLRARYAHAALALSLSSISRIIKSLLVPFEILQSDFFLDPLAPLNYAFRRVRFSPLSW